MVHKKRKINEFSYSYSHTPEKIIGTRKARLPKWKTMQSFGALKLEYPEKEKYLNRKMKESMKATTLKKQNNIWVGVLKYVHEW